jgi:hypothetical protein
MNMSQTHRYHMIALITVLFWGCGADDSENPLSVSGSSSYLDDSSLQAESVSLALTDAIEALGDSSISNNSNSLSLQQNSSRSCSVDDQGQAIVSIERSMQREWTRDTARATRSVSMTGTASMERTWSHTDYELSCNQAGTHAAIRWDDSIAGLSLALSFERSQSFTSSTVLKRTEDTTERSLEHSASGTRSISWLTHTDNDDNTYTRTKKIQSNVNRSHQAVDSDGQTQTLSFSVTTAEDAPLLVEITRDATSHAAIQRKITSGSLIAVKTNQGKIVSTFENFTISFDSESCSPVSGTLTAQFYPEGSDEANRILKLTAEEGVYTLTDVTDDANPVTIEDFEYTSCSVSDFNF